MIKRWTAAVLISMATVPITGQAVEARPDARTQAATSALLEAMRVDRPTAAQLLQLILDDQFEALESKIRTLDEAFSKNPVYETALVRTFEIPGARDDLRGHLDAWVRTTGSGAAYAARAAYLEDRGYGLRGNSSAAKTPPENFKAMAEMHEQGRKDALRALDINPRFVPAYLSLLKMERAGGTLENSARITEIGTRQIPQSYYMRFEFIQTLQPRWGGSYEAMNSYATKEQASLGKNARIYGLLGEVAADKARILSRQGEHQKAIEAATEALSYGERMAHLELRAKAYVALGQFDLAANDFRRMVAIDPADDASKSKADVYEKMPRLLIEKR